MSWYPDLLHDQAGGDGGPRSQTQMVVIHATDNTASDESEARYAETRPDHISANFYSDEDSVIQALDTSHVAYGCFPIGNSRSVQFEIAGRSNQLTDASLRRVAPVVARVCQEYGIPIRKVSAADLAAGARGICGHLDVTNAWGQGDHTDPGASFPWPVFIGYVQAAVAPPPPAPIEEDDEEMSTGQIPAGFAFGGPTGRVDQLVAAGGLGPVNGGAYRNKGCVLGLAADFTPTAGVQLRVAIGGAAGWNVQMVTLHSREDRHPIFLPDATTKFTIGRVKRTAGDEDIDPTSGNVTESAETCPVWWDLEFENR